MAEEFFEEFEDGDGLDDHESAMVRQDLFDLDRFEATFAAEGYRGVAVYCQDCAEEHYYPWDMLRENLRVLLETGETPVHEPAFEPDPEQYVQWQYAQGYVDALHDMGVPDRHDLDACPHCGLKLAGETAQSNFCPRCGSVLLGARLREALERRDLDADTVTEILREIGLPG